MLSDFHDAALRSTYAALPVDAQHHEHRRNLIALLGRRPARRKRLVPYDLCREYIATQARRHGRIDYKAALTYYFGVFCGAWLYSNLHTSLAYDDFVARVLDFADPALPYVQRPTTPDEMRAERLDNLAFKRDFNRDVIFNRDLQHANREALAAALGTRMGHVNPRLFAHRWSFQKGLLQAYAPFQQHVERLFGPEGRVLLNTTQRTNRQTLAQQLRDIER